MAESKPQSGNNPQAKVPQVGRGQTVGPPTGGSKPANTPAGSPGQGPQENPTETKLQSQLNEEAITEVESNEQTDDDTTDVSVDPSKVPQFPKNLIVNQGQGEDASDEFGDGPTQPGLIKDFDPKHPAKLKGETEKTRKMTGKGEQEVVPKQVEGPPTPPYAPSQNYDGQLPPPSNEMVTNEVREGSVEEGMPGLIKTAEVRGTTYVDSAITAKQMQHGIKTSEPVRRDRRTKLGRFLVQHPDNPPLTFAAVDRLQAIQLYRQHCGIIASDKETAVTEVN